MSVPTPHPHVPGEAYPDPAAVESSTRWGPAASDYELAPDAGGRSTWGGAGGPAAVPPSIADGPESRPG
jgi:hypothetical protein